MTEAVNSRCPDHEDPFDCPDCLIHYVEETGEYGIIIHDGGTAFIVIRFCPWCGKALLHCKATENKQGDKAKQNRVRDGS